jgi:hypothetical protein
MQGDASLTYKSMMGRPAGRPIKIPMREHLIKVAPHRAEKEILNPQDEHKDHPENQACINEEL